MLIAGYDKTSNPTAPRGSFTCLFCGNKISRRLSKVKNPERVFCNNTCRGLFVERAKLNENMLTGAEFRTEVLSPEFKKAASYCIYRAQNKYLSARRYSYDELWQECCIAAWKYGKRSNNGQGSKYGFLISCFENAIKRFLQKNDWTVEEISLNDVEPIFSCNMESPGVQVILKEIETNAIKKRNWAWFRDYYIDNKPSSAIAETYNVEMREVVCAISYLKKSLRKKYLETA